MSHEVETMFSVREKPWHYEMTKDVTRIIQEAPTSEEALEAAGLNWTVNAQPVFLESGSEIPNTFANVRDTDNSVLGIVSGRYKIVQNADAFAFTDEMIGGRVRYETAGSLCGGRKVWLLTKTPTVNILGDDVEPYICFTNSHDGTGSVMACITPVRVVCNNTLNLALGSASRKWSTKHIGDVKGKVEEARETLNLSAIYMERLKEEAENLAITKVDTTMLERILNHMFPSSEDNKRQQENAQKQKDEFMVCYLRPDLANFIGTAWGVVNAAADMAGHSAPVRLTKNYAETNWSRIMNGHALVDMAYSMVK